MSEEYSLDDSRHPVWGAVVDAVPLSDIVSQCGDPWDVCILIQRAVTAAVLHVEQEKE